MTKEEILERITKLQKELERLCLKQQIFSEVITHLRDRSLNAERRKKEIHNEIQDIKAQVKIWEETKKQQHEK